MKDEITKRGKKGRLIVFKADFDGKPEKALRVDAYLFDQKGRLIISSSVKDGQTKFQINKKDLKGARLFFGPELLKERYSNKTTTLETMERLQAYEPAWRYSQDREVYELSPIPEVLWRWWWWCFCRARGQVLKMVDTEGATYQVPVCNARVHICEVDPLLLVIPRLPDPIVWRFRDELFKVLEEPPRPVPHEPGPLVPDDLHLSKNELVHEAQLAKVSQVIGPSIGRSGEAELGPQPIPPGAPLRLSGSTISPTLPTSMLRMKVHSGLPAESRVALNSNSLPSLRRALIDNVSLIQPYVCLWDWLWPYFLRCDEVAMVTTDNHGRFDTSIAYQCFGDRPDLYFWIEYPIDGVFETVYRPNMHCHTYWNYECGSEITIRVTDERVPGCWERPEVIGKKVVVKSIGTKVSMGDINRFNPLWSLTGVDKEGTGKAGELNHSYFTEWTPKEVAFGGMLEPRVDFGNGLKEDNITHYLWSYRLKGSSNDWTPIDNVVRRYYLVATPPEEDAKYDSVRLGPDDDGLFVIEPETPEDGEGGEDCWETLNEHHDLASARFDTCVSFDEILDPDGVGFGKVELKLELFRKSGDGDVERIDLTNEGVELYEITTPAPFIADEIDITSPTSDRKIEEDVDGESHLFGYRLVLHIDNRVCFGTIHAPEIDGAGAGPCGFLEYDSAMVPSPSVDISFRASHPGGFAAFNFVTTRVTTYLHSASAHQLVEATEAEEFDRLPGTDTFTTSVPVAKLLSEGVPPGDCVRAAFAENLYVYALVTNGYHRLWELDGPRSTLEDLTQIDVRAFAITPEEPTS